MKKLIALLLVSQFSILACLAQPPQQKMGKPDGGLMNGLDMSRMETSFVLNINSMDEPTKEKLNRVASNYRSHNRSILTDMGNAMLAGGVASVVNVVATEIINLTQIRSK